MLSFSIMRLDAAYDLANHLPFRLPDSTLDHVLGEDAEPHLPLIERGGVGRGEVQGEPTTAIRPLHHLCMLMKAEIVGDDVKMFMGIEPGRGA
jgi:hypothetical protein